MAEYIDPKTGQKWLTLEEAASKWGVASLRVYKWIRGRKGSKGTYRLRDGTPVQRREEEGSRKRLFEEKNDYVALPGPAGRAQYFINPARGYPEPIYTPLVRPVGPEMGQGERHSTISYEANKFDPPSPPYTQVPDPFTNLFPGEASLVYRQPAAEKPEKAEKPKTPKKSVTPESVAPVVRKAGKTAGKPEVTKPPPAPKAPAAPVAPTVRKKMTAAETAAMRAEWEKKLLTEEPEVEETSEEAGNLPIEEVYPVARLAADMAKARYAGRNNLDPARVTDADFRLAASGLASQQTLQSGERVTAREILMQSFDKLVSSLYGDPQYPWASEPALIADAREVFVQIFAETGPIDGMPRRTRMPLAGIM